VSLWSIHTQTCTFQGWTYGFGLFSQQRVRPHVATQGRPLPLQQSNADAQTQFVSQNQNYGLTASFASRERFGMDLAYNFNSVIQNALICFNDRPPAGGILPFVANAVNNNCAGNDTANNLRANSYYTNHLNFGMTTIRFNPTKGATLDVGYSSTSVDGNVPQFNVLQYKYQQPEANLSIDIRT
jgi:hypothetical protein